MGFKEWLRNQAALGSAPGMPRRAGVKLRVPGSSVSFGAQ